MRVYTTNPYSYNSVLKSIKDNSISVSPTANEALLDITCNSIGKYLGIDTKKEWNQYYEKVVSIVRWAKEQTHSKEIPKLVKAINEKLNTCPQMGYRRIDDLAFAIKFDAMKKPKEEMSDLSTEKEEPKKSDEKEKEVKE